MMMHSTVLQRYKIHRKGVPESVMVTTKAHLTFFIYSGVEDLPHLLISPFAVVQFWPGR